MNKGIVLIVTDKDEQSVPKVINHLQEIDQPFFRLDVGSFVELQSKIITSIKSGVVAGYIQSRDGKKSEFGDIKSVWFRKPKPFFVSENISLVEKKFIESEFKSTLWSLYSCLDSAYWMNHPLYAQHLLEHNKLFQLKLAEESGLIVPDTVITNSSDQLIEFCENHGGFLAVKSVCSSIFQEIDGVATGIYTNKVSTDYLKDHVGDIVLAPIMAQEYVPKKLEFRITIVGRNIFACAIHSQDSERTKDDWRRYDFAKVKHESYDLPLEIKTALLKFMEVCQITFGAIDMILTPEGKYVFLEVNPNGQYGWIEDLTNLPISKSIAETLVSGCEL